MRIAILVTDDWFFWSNRLGLARSLRDAGHQVLVVTSDGQLRPRIEAEGFAFAAVRFERSLVGQLKNLPLVQRIAAVYRAFAPDVVHHVSFLPITLGTAAARLARVPLVVNAVTGLGHAFVEGGAAWPLRKAVELGYRSAFAGQRVRAIFQNEDDLSLLVERGLLAPARATVIRGSGVDTERFRPLPEPGGPPVVLFSGRMLWSKGAGILVEACELLRARGVQHRLVLAGMPHADNPDAIPRAVLEGWSAEGQAEWLGQREDMPDLLAAAHVVCLPSWYREGVPMALLEGAASGRPLVTTDSPGCRDIVRAGQNGLLVPVRDVAGLAEALATLLKSPELRQRMGRAGRALVEREFSSAVVGARTLELYRRELPTARSAA